MIQTIRKAWGIPELRKKIVFTLLILLIFRLGNAIMVPYINRDALALQMQVWGTGLLGLYNVMSGGAFATATVFALSIQPYINSSIIIQLLTVAIPALERLARGGPALPPPKWVSTVLINMTGSSQNRMGLPSLTQSIISSVETPSSFAAL